MIEDGDDRGRGCNNGGGDMTSGGGRGSGVMTEEKGVGRRRGVIIGVMVV
jgi:hypothetical protein